MGKLSELKNQEVKVVCRTFESLVTICALMRTDARPNVIWDRCTHGATFRIDLSLSPTKNCKQFRWNPIPSPHDSLPELDFVDAIAFLGNIGYPLGLTHTKAPPFFTSAIKRRGNNRTKNL